jgi:sec-independent protein translocase protein TatA
MQGCRRMGMRHNFIEENYQKYVQVDENGFPPINILFSWISLIIMSIRSERQIDPPYAGGDRMFGLGLPELLVILVILLIVVGPSKLPKAGAAIGKAIAAMRAAMDSAQNGEPKDSASTKESDDPK